jgi:hypothetical protein
MKAHMASMRAKQGASDSGGLLSPGTRLILLPGPIDRAPIQHGSVLPVHPLNSIVIILAVRMGWRHGLFGR